MPSFEQLPSGRFRGVYRDAAGNKQHTKGGTFRLQSEALAAAQDAQVAARRQAPSARGPLPASTTWGEWWDILVADRDFESDNALVEKSAVKAHLRPQWGEIALNEIDNLAIQDWVDSLCKRRTPRGKRYSPAYVRRIYSVFTVSINAAVRKKILTVSPLAGVKLPKIPRRRKSYMSVAEADVYGAQLRTPKQRGALDDYADDIDFVLETGLRPGELAGLHDDQVDTVRRVLTVSTVYVPRKKKMRGYPKDEDERTIPLTAKAMEIYRRRTEGRAMRRPCGIEHFDEPCSSDLVFRSRLGRVLNIDALAKAMKRAASEAGVADRSPYALRRGFATRLRDNGADVATIMELMGHERFDQSHSYMQQPPDFDQKVRAALDDPEATGLRVVGQDSERGTDRGTRVDGTPLDDTGPHRDRKHA